MQIMLLCTNYWCIVLPNSQHHPGVIVPLQLQLVLIKKTNRFVITEDYVQEKQNMK